MEIKLNSVLFSISSMLITPAITFASFLCHFFLGKNAWSAIGPFGSFREKSLFFYFFSIMSPSESLELQKGYFINLVAYQKSGQPVLLTVGKINNIIDVAEPGLSTRPMKADCEISMRGTHNYGSLFLPLLI